MINDLIEFKSIEAAFFDFDGVLVDSVPVKGRAYEAIFHSYGDPAVQEIRKYHAANGGIDRFTKIKHVLSHIGVPADDSTVQKLADRFSELTLNAVVGASVIPGPWTLLQQFHSRGLPCFVVSGTPQDELERIIAMRSLEKLFREVCGSPDSKMKILTRLLSKYGINPRCSIFFGDASTDFHAAMSAGMYFIGIPAEAAQDQAHD